MSQILEALAVIKGKDDTGGAFDAVASKIGRIARAANALNRDVQKQMNLASSAAANAERHIDRTSRAHASIASGAKMAAGAALSYVGARALGSIAHETIRASEDRSHETARMDASGMSEQEIEDAKRLAGDISKKFPSISQTEMMHTARNVRSMVGTFEEATHVLEPLARLRVVALGAHPEKAEELNEDFDKLAKGMEIKGVTQDRGKFEHYIDNMAKAVNVFGDTLRPTDYYEMFKYGRAATNALSDDFMLKTAPTLAQELGGSSAGKALSSFYSQMVGGKMSNKSVEALEEYGLINPDKVIKTKTGNIKGVKPGGVAGEEYLRPGQTDPYLWINKVLVPALAKKGVTDPAKIQEVIAAVASQQTSAQMMSIFATQQSRIEKDQHLVGGAKGGAAAEEFQKNDPKVIRKSIGAQADNLLANTTEPIMPAANQGLNWLASGLSALAEHAKEKPEHIIAGGGWLAGMLSALSVDGVLKATEKVSGGTSFITSKLAGSLAPVLGFTQLASDIMDDHDTERLKRYEAGPRSRLDRLAALDNGSGWGPARDELGHMKSPGLLDRYIWPEDDGRAAERARLNSELEGFGYNPAVTQGRWDTKGSPGWSIDDIRKATGIGSAEPVKAEVEGQAKVDVAVKVEASPSLLASIEQKIATAVMALRSTGTTAKGSTGSTGQSAPDAAPSP
jgi:hypothetical protein